VVVVVVEEEEEEERLALKRPAMPACWYTEDDSIVSL
jgi:hypothetical protein